MPDVNFAVLGYLPPKGIGTVESFLANMKRFPSKHPLLFYSHAWKSMEGVIPMIADVDHLRERFPKKKMAVNNAVFYTGLRIAAAKGLTHFLCIEPDCRVNCAGWDDIIWQEFLSKNAEAICGGTIVTFNPTSWGRVAAERYERFLIETKPIRPMPMAVAGGGHTAEKHQPCIFPNGALAIYRMDWLLKVFPEVVNGGTIDLAYVSHTWDAEIGYRLWGEFDYKTYDNIVCAGSIYSGYGDVMSSEAERQKLLESGRVVAVHQVKSEWTGPERAVEASLWNMPYQNKFREMILEDIRKAREILKGNRVDLPLIETIQPMPPPDPALKEMFDHLEKLRSDAGSVTATARSPIPDARPTSVGGKAEVPASSEKETNDTKTETMVQEAGQTDGGEGGKVSTVSGISSGPTLSSTVHAEPKTDIFIVTFARDFAYLRYCLRSIRKFCTGFHEIRVLVPRADEELLSEVIVDVWDNNDKDPLPIVLLGDEWPGKGMLWHEAQIMRADQWCPEADYILHFDSDCLFTAPVTPSTFFKDGKPVLRYESFESVSKREPGVLKWQECTAKCLPFDESELRETMRGHPHVYRRGTYDDARWAIQNKTGMDADDYIKAQQNEFPQGFAEHITLGNVALQATMAQPPSRELYSLEPLDGTTNPDRSRWPVIQFWAHSPPDKAQTIWLDGEKASVVPADIAEGILK